MIDVIHNPIKNAVRRSIFALKIMMSNTMVMIRETQFHMMVATLRGIRSRDFLKRMVAPSRNMMPIALVLQSVKPFDFFKKTVHIVSETAERTIKIKGSFTTTGFHFNEKCKSETASRRI